MKLVHSKDGVEVATSQIIFSHIASLSKYNLKAEVSTACETFKAAKVVLDFGEGMGLLKGDLDLNVEWNFVNKRSAKLSYEVTCWC